MMFKLSKNKEKFIIGKDDQTREYRTTKWSAITTVLEGKKILSVIAPSLAAMADMKLSDKADSLDTLVDGGDTQFFITGAVTQFFSNFSDEHFADLVEKLFKGLEIKDKEKDEWVVIEDIDEYLTNNPDDFEEIVIKTFKANLYDFFIKQATVRSIIQKMMPVVEGVTNSLNKNMNQDSIEE